MTKIFKCFLSVALIVFFVLLSVMGAVAETVAEDGSHDLSLTLPDGYVLLSSDTAEDNIELIESLGYSLSSFKSYLKPTTDGAVQTLFLGLEPSSKSQISVKSWSTDFSKKISNLALLDDESLAKTAKELVTAKGASYKTVSANGMKLIETRLNGKDSGGDFCSVQYVTVCNNNFYCLNFTFSGKVNEQKISLAWNTLSSFEIETGALGSAWDFGSVLIVIVLSLAIVGAVALAVIIIYTTIKDIKKRRTDPDETYDFIERRKP